MHTPSLLRRAEHEALKRVHMSGSVLDLGGDTRSEYRTLFGRSCAVTTLNADPDADPDIVHDLETPLPIESASFDVVLLVNVLEHVFNYRALLQESVRVLKPGGNIVVMVPFLFPVHPSPRDFYRFTREALQREFQSLGLVKVRVTPLGTGVFSVRHLFLNRLLPRVVRLLSYYTLRYAIVVLDALFAKIGRATGKKYDPADYALGYCAVAEKPDVTH